MRDGTLAMGCRASHVNQELVLGKTWVQGELGHWHEEAKTSSYMARLPVSSAILSIVPFHYDLFSLCLASNPWLCVH